MSNIEVIDPRTEGHKYTEANGIEFEQGRVYAQRPKDGYEGVEQEHILCIKVLRNLSEVKNEFTVDFKKSIFLDLRNLVTPQINSRTLLRDTGQQIQSITLTE